MNGGLNSTQARSIHTTLVRLAKVQPKKPLGGKSKVKQGFKTKQSNNEPRAKKGGMTHLGFRDAVRSLGFEKNAPEVPLDTLSNKNLSLGEIVKYSPSTESKLSTLGSFKKYQHHELFRNPILLISRNLVNLNETFIENIKSSSKNNRFLLLGDHRIGKSTLITQAQALIDDKTKGDAVFLHLDHAERIGEGTSDYLLNKKMGLYQQPMLTKRWIVKIREANKEVLQKMPLSQSTNFTTNKTQYKYVAGKNNLYEYLVNCHDFGKSLSTSAFEFFIKELQHHSKKFPVILSVDNFNAVTTHPLTKYKTPEFEPIHVSQFELGKFILDFVSGTKKFHKGGILLSESNDIGKHDNLSIGLGLKDYDPYQHKTLDTKIIQSLDGVKPFHVEYLPKENVKGLCQFYHDSGVLFIRNYMYKEDDRDIEYGLSQISDLQFTNSGGNPGLLLKHVTMGF